MYMTKYIFTYIEAENGLKVKGIFANFSQVEDEGLLPRRRPSSLSSDPRPFYRSQQPSHQAQIHPYLLRETSETPHQIHTSPRTGVFRESRG
jgi:hypothetical protein